jgi:hypothetical protein
MIATVVLAAQYTGTLDVSDSTRADMRLSQPPLTVTETEPVDVQTPLAGTVTTGKKVIIGADLTTSPVARLALRGRRWDFSLSYSPSLTLPDIELGFVPSEREGQPEFLVMNNALAAVSWHDRFVRFAVSESATYGEVNATLLLPGLTSTTGTMTAMTTTPGGGTATTPSGGTATAPGGTMAVPGGPAATATAAIAPQTRNIEFASSSTNAGISAQTGRHGTLSVFGGYQLSGGLDATARSALGEQYGPNVGVSFGYVLSRRDTIGIAATAQDTFTTLTPPNLTPEQLAAAVAAGNLPLCGPLSGTPPTLCHTVSPGGALQATVVHLLSRTASLSLAGGVAAYYDETVTPEIVIQPVGTATLADSFGPRGASSFSLSATIAPTVDVRTGRPSDRLQVAGSLSLPMSNLLALNINGGLLQSVPFPTNDPNPITAITASGEVRMRVDRRVDVAAGVQTLWQQQFGFGLGLVASEIAYVTATARAPTLRF